MPNYSPRCRRCSGEDCCCCEVWLDAQADMSPESQREAEDTYQESQYLDPNFYGLDDEDFNEDDGLDSDEDDTDELSCFFDDEIRFEHDDGMG